MRESKEESQDIEKEDKKQRNEQKKESMKCWNHGKRLEGVIV